MRQIIKIFFLFFIIIYSYALQSQNYLNLPESVVYDSVHNRYLVSNWGSGDIVQIDSTGTQSIFLNNEQCFAGLHIIDSVLYVACREYGVKGFNLNTGENVLDVDIAGATNINDITSDNSGNLYVSYPTGNTIYKVNIAAEQGWVFTNSGLSVPNGLYFDESENRLLVVSYRMNSPIQEVILTDSTAFVIVYPGLNNLDGITQDNDGNFYISSWFNNRVYRLDNTFTNPPEVFSNHNDDPADIFFDKQNDVLAVPLFFTHQVEFIEAGTGINISNVYLKSEILLMQNYPNPFNPSTTISFELNSNTIENIELIIYNIKGRKVKTIINKVLPVGKHSIAWDGADDNNQPVSSGIYYCSIKMNKQILSSKKMMLIK